MSAMKANPIKSRRTNQTNPNGEAPMNSNPQVGATEPDDVLDDWLDAADRAAQRAQLAEAAIPSIQAEIDKGNQAVARFLEAAAQARAEAAKNETDADQIARAVKELEDRKAAAHKSLHRHRTTAESHERNITTQIGLGATDPRGRRAARAKLAAEQGVPNPQPLPPQPNGNGLAGTALDGPNPPLGLGATRPSPIIRPEDLQGAGEPQ